MKNIIEATIDDLSFLIIKLFILTPLYNYRVFLCFFQYLFFLTVLFIIFLGDVFMYNMSFLENIERDNFLNILNNKGIYCYVDNDSIYISVLGKLVHECSVSNLFLNDICDILGISIIDNKYLYYFLDIAYDNSFDKKKSLRL